MTTINQRIRAIRQLLEEKKLDAYIIPDSDPHQSEYVAAHWKCREWISGFSGSAGTVIITPRHAGLWTDSRYFIQAEEELSSSEMVLHKLGASREPEHFQWLSENLPDRATIGLDGRLFSLLQIRQLQKIVQPKNISIDAEQDLITPVWKDRPPLPEQPIFQHETTFAGKDCSTKLAAIRKEMKQRGVRFHLLTALDDIAWTFNLRGSDVDYNPVFISYAVIGQEEAWLFVEASKVPAMLAADLQENNIRLLPYTALDRFLTSLAKDQPVLVHSGSLNYHLSNLLTSEQLKGGDSIPRILKARKNATEIAHTRQAMQRDGVAVLRTLRYLHRTLDEGRTISEFELGEYLQSQRKSQTNYVGESFPPIVGYQQNGAIIHYRAARDTCANIQKEGILLMDSGGQYLDGTTDITRTFALDIPTGPQKKHYTLVLKGHLALSNAVFPKGTKGIQLDALARQPIWQHRLNYGHGTGHGVGFFLNVHEPPQSISSYVGQKNVAFEPGMITSNEPGLYFEGKYGIRIENLVLCVESTPGADFYQFEDLTLFPYEKSLIDLSMLTRVEISQINAYHKKVWEGLSPLLTASEQRWLEEQCADL